MHVRANAHMIQEPLALWERELRMFTALTKGACMAAEIGNEMREQAQELMAQGKEVAAEYYEEGRNQVLAWQQQLENQVREKPLQSLLIAAGVGLLFGLLRRR
jgi:ElaB/YqjD/DUF883 family membrane-anchored ribosome-binding protein